MRDIKAVQKCFVNFDLWVLLLPPSNKSWLFLEGCIMYVPLNSPLRDAQHSCWTYLRKTNPSANKIVNFNVK